MREGGRKEGREEGREGGRKGRRKEGKEEGREGGLIHTKQGTKCMWMRDLALMVRVSVVGWDSVAMARDKLRCSSLKTAPSVEEYGVNGWEGRGLGGGTVM